MITQENITIMRNGMHECFDFRGNEVFKTTEKPLQRFSAMVKDLWGGSCTHVEATKLDFEHFPQLCHITKITQKWWEPGGVYYMEGITCSP